MSRRARPPRIAIVLGVAGLTAGLAVGYAAGHHPAASAAPVSAPGAAGLASSPAQLGAASPEGGSLLLGPDSLVQSGGQCTAQTGGHLLQLGVQVSNQSAALLTLNRVTTEEPPAGLKVNSRGWGTCGELPSARTPPAWIVPPGSSTWFTVTFRVLVHCPGALPVSFSVNFFQRGQKFTTQLPGFVDLGHVPYRGCPVAG